MKGKEFPIENIILDFSLYPRLDVDDVHVARLAEALQAGRELPPILLDAKSMRCVDGFHRVKAHRRAQRKTIRAVLATHETEGELLLAAIRANSAHGRPLAPAEQVRCAILADGLLIERAQVANALAVRVEVLDWKLERQTATGALGRVPLKPALRHLRGQELTPEQERTNAHAGGHQARYYARMLLELTQADALDRSDAVLMERLRALMEALAAWFGDGGE